MRIMRCMSSSNSLYRFSYELGVDLLSVLVLAATLQPILPVDFALDLFVVTPIKSIQIHPLFAFAKLA
jgi:hypothetical protein